MLYVYVVEDMECDCDVKTWNGILMLAVYVLKMHLVVIKLKASKAITLSLYKSSKISDNIFFDSLELLLDFLPKFHCNTVLCDGFNIEAQGHKTVTASITTYLGPLDLSIPRKK